MQDPTTFAASIPARESFFHIWAGIDTSASLHDQRAAFLPADGAGNFVSPGSVIDVNEFGTVTSVAAPITGTYSPVLDGNGRGTLGFGGNHTSGFYMIGAEVLRMVETDDWHFIRRGPRLGTGAAPSAGYDVTALTGNFAFNENAQGGLGPVGVAGQLTADGAGNVTGFADANEGGFLSSGAIAGTYAVPDPTSARVVVTLAPGTGSTFTTDVSNVIVYLTDPALNVLDPTNPLVGAGAITMEADGTTNGVGNVVEQSPASQTGNYAVSAQIDALSTESDLVGQGLSDGTANIAGNGDENQFFTPVPDEPLALTFAADPNNPGRFTGTVSFNGSTPVDIVYYQVSSTQLFVIQADPTSSDVCSGLPADPVTINREGHGRTTGRALSHFSVSPASLPAHLTFALNVAQVFRPEVFRISPQA